jgi:hypothetical protein
LFADDKKLVSKAAVSAVSSPSKSNPLNPLNLSDIVVPTEERSSVTSWLDADRAYTGVIQSATSLPAHLRLATSLKDIRLETRKSHLPCFSMAQHTPNPDFTGRSATLSLMDKALLPNQQLEKLDVNVFAICGMGGIGKTDLAVEYAYSRRKHFGAVFWLDAGGVSLIAADFARIPTYLGLETTDELQDLAASKELAKSWLEQPRNSYTEASDHEENDTWLLIFDNADNLDVITDYLPYRGRGSILITSRDPSAKTHFSSTGTGIDLEPLSAFEGATLLRKLVTKTEDPGTIDEENASMMMSKELDGLPLAVTQMAGLLGEGNCPSASSLRSMPMI